MQTSLVSWLLSTHLSDALLSSMQMPRPDMDQAPVLMMKVAFYADVSYGTTVTFQRHTCPSLSSLSSRVRLLRQHKVPMLCVAYNRLQ